MVRSSSPDASSVLMFSFSNMMAILSVWHSDEVVKVLQPHLGVRSTYYGNKKKPE